MIYASARPDPAFFEVLDVAHRIAGTGSLGLERYVVLIEGKGSPNGNYLLDLKQSLASSLARGESKDRLVACRQQGPTRRWCEAIRIRRV
jgi:uncharacterized protein (DUF2252 family)